MCARFEVGEFGSEDSEGTTPGAMGDGVWQWVTVGDGGNTMGAGGGKGESLSLGAVCGAEHVCEAGDQVEGEGGTAGQAHERPPAAHKHKGRHAMNDIYGMMWRQVGWGGGGAYSILDIRRHAQGPHPSSREILLSSTNANGSCRAKITIN